ncbi:peptide chain release factor N(5)-glutamine methyltransferase [Rhodovastum atsumiense]|uniref:Release factor glutamine methyltransferase n=1 Tax=Rhodovastum atsumiense TaxID=504468 RepID=A0A5M6IU30_9PROT|nr:peptide chain release factor N(5)-glutamine methyltransferase [Rhodovastum atsumiense]KAA5611357.1 peptide chain release factor N(5)-glutamine methyltransferase [Rhodovastum atsumiense]
MTKEDLLREATTLLRDAGIDEPRREARLLYEHAAGDPTAFHVAVARRAAREPMALITGRQGFWTLDLAVSRATLIPRPDTETLIEAALAARPDRAAVRRILDLGTGTGCLLLAALAEFPLAFGVGVDLVPEAAALAAANARANGLAGRAAFLAGDWAAALSGRFDLVLSNPPYIESDAIPGLMPEVAAFEPRSALDGGADGMAAYRFLVKRLPRLLAPGGVAVLELGAGQAAGVAALARAAGLDDPVLRADLAGIARAAVLTLGHD